MNKVISSTPQETAMITDVSVRPIVLIGLMGAGKSTIGRRLASKMHMEFIDSDDEIEDAAGCSIADIFAIYGESIFRDLEQRVLARLLDGERKIIATGGGAWMQPVIRELIMQKSLSVWLRADLDTLVERVSRRSHRPLLEKGDKHAILEKLMAERYPIYEKADVIVDSSGGSHEMVVQKIQQTITTHIDSGTHA